MDCDGVLMPKRTDIHSILIIGSGPIVIGQACEFDYSGTQACRVLREEGYRVILVNSNPATIMTDPDFADATYIEPITPEVVAKIIERERPDAVLPTLGGQTGLNTAMALFERGLHRRSRYAGDDRRQRRGDRHGRGSRQVQAGDDRDRPRRAAQRHRPHARRGHGSRRADRAADHHPPRVHPRRARHRHRLDGGRVRAASPRDGLAASPISEILIEKSIAGWKEYELEVMRDRADNCVIICSIENVDPMGVHTGDSITVAPAQTLSDVEYQQMRDAAFAVHPSGRRRDRRQQRAVRGQPGDRRAGRHRDEPAVSRSSALASKATGFPIAKIAAKLAVGYTLDEIPNDITRR